MQKSKSLTRAFGAMLIIGFLSLATHAQDNVQLPPPLNQSSSLAETVDWLNKNAFPYARISVNARNTSHDNIGTASKVRGNNSFDFIFSPGFKVSEMAGCNVTLRNDQARMINDSFDNEPRSVELILPLAKMSDRKGKPPYRHTRNPRIAKLFGTWRTEFIEKGFFVHGIFDVNVGESEHRFPERGNGDRLKFAFDDKEAADNFNVAFRHAIKLCSAK